MSLIPTSSRGGLAAAVCLPNTRQLVPPVGHGKHETIVSQAILQSLNMPKASKKPAASSGDPRLTRATHRAAREKNKVTSPVFARSRAGTSVPRPVHRPGGTASRRAKSAQDLTASAKRKRQGEDSDSAEMDLSIFKGKTLQRTPVKAKPPPAKKTKPKEDTDNSSTSTLQDQQEVVVHVDDKKDANTTETEPMQEDTAQPTPHQSTPSPTERAQQQAAQAGLHKASEILKKRQERATEGSPSRSITEEQKAASSIRNLTHIDSISDVGSDMTQDNTLEAEHALLQTIRKSKVKHMEHIQQLHNSLHFSPALPKAQYKARESALFQEEPVPPRGESSTPGRPQGQPERRTTVTDYPGPNDSRANDGREPKHTKVLNPPDLIHEDEFNIPGESIARMRDSLANLTQHIQDNANYLSRDDKFVLCTARDDLSQRIQQFCIVRGHLYCAEGKQAHGIKLLSVGKELESKLQQAMQALLAIPGSPEQRSRSHSTISTLHRNRSMLQAAEKSQDGEESKELGKSSKNGYKTAKNRTRPQPIPEDTFRHSRRVGDNLESTKNSNRSTQG